METTSRTLTGNVKSTASICGTYPIAPGGSLAGESPKTRTVPASGWIRPATVLRRVDFPDPFGPTIPSAVPRSTVSETPSSATTRS